MGTILFVLSVGWKILGCPFSRHGMWMSEFELSCPQKGKDRRLAEELAAVCDLYNASGIAVCQRLFHAWIYHGRRICGMSSVASQEGCHGLVHYPSISGTYLVPTDVYHCQLLGSFSLSNPNYHGRSKVVILLQVKIFA